jgi:ADP-heptose:LPS heptosyltransferase
MNILKTINALRRFIMRMLTKKIGSSKPTLMGGVNREAQIRKILVCRPNHRLGNLLMTTPMIQELINAFPQARIDLFVKGSVATEIFRSYNNINHIMQLPRKPVKALRKYIATWLSLKKNDYDLVINIDRNSASGRLATEFAHGKYKFFDDAGSENCATQSNYTHLGAHPVHQLRRFMSGFGIQAIEKAVPSLNLKLTTDELTSGLRKLSLLVDPRKATLCLFTFATGAKCFPESWWQEFYLRIKQKFPNHNVIEVLPIENVSLISFEAPAFYSRNIREIGSLIANGQLFIGADSGMMHLANASQTPTIGLFSVTDSHLYGPYGNQSVGLNMNQHTVDDCLDIAAQILATHNIVTLETRSGELKMKSPRSTVDSPR